MKRRSWFLIGAVLIAAVLSVGAIACGDDDGDGDEPTATVGLEPTEPAAETPGATEPAGETPAGASVTVTLAEYRVLADVSSAAAGSVTFNAENVGGNQHELVIIRTDLAPDSLPTADDGSADEAGEGIEVIDEIEEMDPGGTGSLTVDLEAGAYALICNVIDDSGAHYELGMRSAFEVTP